MRCLQLVVFKMIAALILAMTLLSPLIIPSHHLVLNATQMSQHMTRFISIQVLLIAKFCPILLFPTFNAEVCFNLIIYYYYILFFPGCACFAILPTCKSIKTEFKNNVSAAESESEFSSVGLGLRSCVASFRLNTVDAS